MIGFHLRLIMCEPDFFTGLYCTPKITGPQNTQAYSKTERKKKTRREKKYIGKSKEKERIVYKQLEEKGPTFYDKHQSETCDTAC